MPRLKAYLLPGLLAVATLALLLRLGFWQLERADWKQAVTLRAEAHHGAEPVALESALAEGDWTFRPVFANGVYDARRQFLLDNRTHDGRAGYHVYTPLVLGERAVLVNRGWVGVGNSRSRLPEIEPPASTRVHGVLASAPRSGLVLGETGYGNDEAGWPRVVQVLDLAKAARDLGISLLPGVILLDPKQPGCLVCEWSPVVGIGPDRHRGYALQWFSLAVALIVLCALLLRRRIRHGA